MACEIRRERLGEARAASETLKITADPDVIEAAVESGNASAWFNEAGKRYLRALERTRDPEEAPRTRRKRRKS